MKDHDKPVVTQNSNSDPEKILFKALDVAAPDAASWKKGYAAYRESIENGNIPPKTFWDGLDASAPNAKLWRAAWGLIKNEFTTDGNKETTTTEETAHEQELPLRLFVGKYEAVASYHEVSEDCVLADIQKGVFGVFDGMGGGGGNPAAAASAAKNAVRVMLSDSAPSTESHLKNLMRNSMARARSSVELRGQGGSTVGTAIKICLIDGAAVMGVAHAGDTRLFRYKKYGGSYEALTTDQSDGNIVHNSLSPGTGDRLDEYKAYKLSIGDRLMLCSDGITGDWSRQFLSDAEFMEAFKKERPQDCAETFYKLSKKDDDKSVVIIDII